MPQTTNRCQQFSYLRWQNYCQIVGIAALSLSCTGCWEEVHFEPTNNATPSPQKAIELNDKRPTDQPAPEPKAMLDEVEPASIPKASTLEETTS